MVLADYFSRRVFRSPFIGYAETVSGWSACWAFLFGPLFYWRKRAPIEALLFLIATAPLLGFADEVELLGISDAFDLGSVIWTAFALSAPVLLPACYRRKGWEEVMVKQSISGGSRSFAQPLAHREE
jgi:hypothetical protein